VLEEVRALRAEIVQQRQKSLDDTEQSSAQPNPT
jgi:hypothetical protein